jgi:hypothetical protein
MLQGWRSEGFGRDRLEVWVVGITILQAMVPPFANGSEASCFVEGTGEVSAFDAFDAKKDDLFVLDGEGTAQFHMSLADKPLSSETNRQTLDAAVRGLLADG